MPFLHRASLQCREQGPRVRLELRRIPALDGFARCETGSSWHEADDRVASALPGPSGLSMQRRGRLDLHWRPSPHPDGRIVKGSAVLNGFPSQPRLIVTAGLHRSASTWVFNVIRELMVDGIGEERVLALYADQAAAVPADSDDRHVLLKSHSGGPGWTDLIAQREAPVLLSIRDPRDAAISLTQSFNVPFHQSVQALAADCRLALQIADTARTVLRYEDRFFDRPETPSVLAASLCLSPSPGACDMIFARYRTESVRAFAATMPHLEEDRLVVGGDMMFDRVTQIHRTHIGDTRSGKWQSLLSKDTVQRLNQIFAPFLERFGYGP